MSSSIVHCEALVVRNLRFGDTSRVATLFTRELGKIGAIGKGVRDPASPFGASLELLSHSSFVVYFRPGRDLQFLKSGSLEREFRGILAAPRRYLWASALAEYADKMLLEEEPAPEMFDLTLRGLEVIETSPETALPELFLALQLRIAALLGYAPRLDACLGCGRPPADEDGPWVFRPAEGGGFCPSCAGVEEAGGLRLTPRALRRIRAMVRGNPGRGAGEGPVVRDAAQVQPPSVAWLRTLHHLVEDFLRYHVGTYRGLRSLAGLAAWEGALDAPAALSLPSAADRSPAEDEPGPGPAGGSEGGENGHANPRI